MAAEGVGVGLASGQVAWLVALAVLRPRHARQAAVSAAAAVVGAVLHAGAPWLWPLGALLVVGCGVDRERRRRVPRTPAATRPPSPTYIVF